ncbi:MAG: formate/nitrite transporter family protein [Erysipelotrichia bacterium]|nr:formate/nitrite transporter family protein [Erysipelotrichia bacterium]
MKNYFKLFFSSIVGGLAVGVGSFLYLLASYYFPDSFTIGKFVATSLFSTGLIIICLLNLALYTGRVGLFIDERSKIKERIIDLPIILLGNTIGAFAIAILCHFIFINFTGLQDLVVTVANNKISSNMVFMEGVLCGTTVYIAVYSFKNLNNFAMKIIGIIVPIALFVATGLQHCIANMFFFGMAFNWNVGMIWNLIVVILGNSVGALFIWGLARLSALTTKK